MAMAKKDEILQQEIEGFCCLSSEESNDLSYWEFVNPSDADSDDDIDNFSLDSSQNGLFVSWQSSLSSSTPPENQTQTTHFGVLHQDQLVIDGASVGSLEKLVSYEEEEEEEEKKEASNYDDDLYDDDDGYGVDDELVPWSVSGKLGRQRMRKLGKRAFAKMNYSKKSPFWYMKPGCVHGKHGLGLKHSC